MLIIGAGMAGLLAAQMLRRHRPVVCEAQSALPNNHGALLRFRTDAVSRVTGIPFKRVTVHKAVSDKQHRIQTTPTLQDANRYAQRVTGKAMERSIMDLRSGERFIAPPDFMAQLANGVNVEYDSPLVAGEMGVTSEPVISTIPMPALMKIMGWQDQPSFTFRPIWSVRAQVLAPETDLYQTIYYPWDTDYYRASLTGSLLTVEYMGDKPQFAETDVMGVLEDFGLEGAEVNLIGVKEQLYGKILPTDEKQRRAFIMAMTDQFGIYSVGRFATWRQILLDDVVNDVSVVSHFIEMRDRYQRHLSTAVSR